MKRIRAFLDNYVDPAERLAQILFGLIMLLTTTAVARSTLDKEGTKGIEEMIREAIGCNVAWGVITGVLYSMNTLYDRSWPNRLQHDCRGCDDSVALAVIQDNIEESFAEITTPDDRAELARKILVNLKQTKTSPPSIGRKDLVTGLIIFVLVTMTIAALVPFCFTSDLKLAIQLTNILLVVLMFIVGFCWGRVVRMNSWLTGLAITIIGLAMVGVAEYLGG
jgi:hypothetical protein